MSVHRKGDARGDLCAKGSGSVFTRLQLLLLVAVFGSALTVIYSAHLTRKLFSDSQQLSERQLVLDEEWGRLLIERSTWADHDRINKLARAQLSMYAPELDDVQLVKANGRPAE